MEEISPFAQLQASLSTKTGIDLVLTKPVLRENATNTVKLRASLFKKGTTAGSYGGRGQSYRRSVVEYGILRT